MKKTLMALAALTAAGSALAQSNVTVSGKFGYAYESGSAAGVSKSGLGQTDGQITFAASEDLGRGMKAGASLEVRVRGRGVGSVDGRDASVFVSGGFGTVTLGAIELANGILTLGGADAPTIGLDGASIAAPINADVLLYTSPAMGALSFSAAIVDDSMGQYGMQSSALGYSATLLGAAYATGPVSASADYTKFNANAQLSATPTLLDGRFRISASYDLGVAKLGAGYESMSMVATTAGVAGVTNRQTILGVSAPVGAKVSVGANWTRQTQDGVFATVTGTDLAAQYNLSKRTSIQLAYQRVAVENVANDTTNFRARLMHTF